jgi:hypothetical protein
MARTSSQKAEPVSMKLKIVGFKVGKSRPTVNKSFALRRDEVCPEVDAINVANFAEKVGRCIVEVIEKSDFISIRRVDE